MDQNNMVIMQQPQPVAPVAGAPQDFRDWSTGLCACCANPVQCCMSCLCFCCTLCRVSRKMDESCCVPVFLPGGLVALRTKLRTQFGIRGSICGDWCSTYLCFMLTACQMERELFHLGR